MSITKSFQNKKLGYYFMEEKKTQNDDALC